MPSVTTGSRAAALGAVGSTSLSATVPSLQAAGRVRGSYFNTGDVYRGYSDYYYGNYNGNYYGYGGYRSGYCYDYRYSGGSYWGVSIGFGYPYGGWGVGYSSWPYWGCGSSWGWGVGWGVGWGSSYCGSGGWGYPYYGAGWCRPYYSGYRYRRVCATYPYVGYYSVYPYPYLDSYGAYNCDFYDSYSVRFGAYRTSYCAECSGYGEHAYEHHHCHVCDCASHGKHYYHVRDCALCYPSGGAMGYSDVDVPDVTTESDAHLLVPPPEPIPVDAGAVGAASVVEVVPMGQEEAFFASLKPAQLSFAMGLMHTKHGEYDNAVESFYSSSLEDPESRMVKLFLGMSLVSVGEFAYAGEYLRLALDDWETFPSYGWRAQDLYESPEAYQKQITVLEKELALNPSDHDVLLSLGVLQFHGGEVGGAARSFAALTAVSSDAVDHKIAGRYLETVERRLGVEPVEGAGLASTPTITAEDDAVQEFLADPSLQNVATLPIR